MEELQNSVFVEKLIQKGYEVIFFTEAIDEYVMTHLTEFDDKKFQDASKDDLKLGKDDRKGLKKLRVSRDAKTSLSHLVAEFFSQFSMHHQCIASGIQNPWDCARTSCKGLEKLRVGADMSIPMLLSSVTVAELLKS